MTENTSMHQSGGFEENTAFRKLPEKIRKNGFDYQLIRRIDDVAVYSQSDEGKLVAYEVFEIRKAEAGEFMGKTVEAREKMPSNEEWGNNAFTVHTLDRAFQYVKEILKRIKIRDENRERDQERDSRPAVSGNPT